MVRVVARDWGYPAAEDDLKRMGGVAGGGQEDGVKDGLPGIGS